jgi:predicted acetyltransferase
MELITPSVEISESFFEALEKGYVDKSRGKITTDKDINNIKNDFSAFVRTFDEGFAGSISLRWQRGTTDLPYYCLGHIGYEVVEWKRNKGLATFALKSMCKTAQSMKMSFVEIVTDIENKKSQRVIEKSKGRLIETFIKPKHLAQTLSNRYRIYL